MQDTVRSILRDFHENSCYPHAEPVELDGAEARIKEAVKVIDAAWHEMIDGRDDEIRALKQLIARLSKALLKVRPLGGSELFIKVGEEYFADPEYCGSAIEKLHHDLHQANIALARTRKSEPAETEPDWVPLAKALFATEHNLAINGQGWFDFQARAERLIAIMQNQN